MGVGVLSVAGHGLALLALIGAQPSGPREPEPEPMIVSLVRPPPPPPPPAEQLKAPEPAAAAAPTPPPPRRIQARPAKAPSPEVAPLVAKLGPTTEGDSAVSDAELASAGTAESGSGGGGCNMVRWLQTSLRKDRMVQAALAETERGKAIRVWNGQWVRHGAQDGNGLAAVREAIMWEVAFAPVACRDETVHGLVMISLNDGPGSARLVVGSGAWRWSDLLNRTRR